MPSAGLKAPSASRKFPTEYKLIVSRYQQQRSNAGRLAGLRWQESRVGHPCLLPSGKVASLRLLTSPYCNEGAGGHTKGRMRRLDSFPQLLHAYFYDWMARQRNASRHTVLSYRDAWRLFLRFVAQRCQGVPAATTRKFTVAYCAHERPCLPNSQLIAPLQVSGRRSVFDPP